MASSNLAALVNKQVLSWIQRTREHKEEIKNRTLAPVITISREMGSGGRLVAKMVAERLGEPWRVWHRELIDEIARKAHIRKELVEEIDEKTRSSTKEYFSDMFGLELLTLPTYHRYLMECLAGIGQVGYAVVVGRGANFVLKEGLNVRIICPLEKRIEYEMEVEKISKEEASKRVMTSDVERREFVRNLFGKDIENPNNYDMVINVGSINVSDTADLIVEAAKRKWKI